jgi:hypothetical protein
MPPESKELWILRAVCLAKINVIKGSSMQHGKWVIFSGIIDDLHWRAL